MIFIKRYKKFIKEKEAEDILRITGEEDLVSGKYYSDNKYDRLFKIDTFYFLASAHPHDGFTLWFIDPYGYMPYIHSNRDLGLRPVVSLKSEVRTEGVDENGSWQRKRGRVEEIVDSNGLKI